MSEVELQLDFTAEQTAIVSLFLTDNGCEIPADEEGFPRFSNERWKVLRKPNSDDIVTLKPTSKDIGKHKNSLVCYKSQNTEQFSRPGVLLGAHKSSRASPAKPSLAILPMRGLLKRGESFRYHKSTVRKIKSECYFLVNGKSVF